MSKAGKSLLQGAKEALEYTKGRKKTARTHKVKVPAQISAHSIRNDLHKAGHMQPNFHNRTQDGNSTF